MVLFVLREEINDGCVRYRHAAHPPNERHLAKSGSISGDYLYVAVHNHAFDFPTCQSTANCFPNTSCMTLSPVHSAHLLVSTD